MKILLLASCAVLLFSTHANSSPELSFSTEWSTSADGTWLDHSFWEDGIPDGQTTAVMRGGKADGEPKPYTVIIDGKGINTQGDHPAGMIVLSHGAKLVLRKNGVLDLSRRTGLEEIKKFGKPPASKTGGRDWGTIPTTDDGGGGNNSSTDVGDEAVSSTSAGTAAGIVIGVLLVFVAVAGVALKFSKDAEKNKNPTLPNFFPSPTVASVTNPAFSSAPLDLDAQSSSNAPVGAGNSSGGGVADGSDGYAAPVGAVDAHGNVVARPRPRSWLMMQSESEFELYDAVYTMNPLSGLEETEVVALAKAVENASIHCGGGPYDDQVELANVFYDETYPDGINSRTANGAAALPRRDATVLHVFTQETKLYKGLNGALGDYGENGRAALPQYLQLTKLLIVAARKLAPLPPVTVYRGVTRSYLELLGGLGVGGRLTWWSFTSTTRTPDVLRTNQFLGIGSAGSLQSTHRTVFQIRVTDGRDIHAYSAVPAEDEVLLLPGSTFVIEEINFHAFNVVEIKMKQVAPARFALGVEAVAEQDLAAYASIAEEEDDYKFEPFDAYSGLGDSNVYQVADGDGTVSGDDDGHYDMPDSLIDDGKLDAAYESVL